MFQPVNNDSIQLSVEPARGRQTADNSFGAMLERGAQTAAALIGNGVRAVAPLLPGGSYVSAVADAVGQAVGQAVGTIGSVAGADPIGAGGAGGDQWALLRAQERLQQEGLANSMQLLALQQRMNRESQAFTATSNVMKARHDMAMAAVNNLR